MDSFIDVQMPSVTARPAAVETPRPASAGPLIIRLDDASNVRPSSALSRNITSHLLLSSTFTRCYSYSCLLVCIRDASEIYVWILIKLCTVVGLELRTNWLNVKVEVSRN